MLIMDVRIKFFNNTIDKPIGCGDENFARIFFFSYTLIVGMIFIRVFIAVILQNF